MGAAMMDGYKGYCLHTKSDSSENQRELFWGTRICLGLCNEDSLLVGERSGGGRGKEERTSVMEQLVSGYDR